LRWAPTARSCIGHGPRHDDDDGVPLVLAVQRLFALEVVAAVPPQEAEAGRRRDGKASEGQSKATGRWWPGARS
jgi:hypothetical protein